jgi:hypothetical protein
MTQDLHLHSAKIYQFPASGRAGVGGRREMATPAEPFAAPLNTKAVSSAWYHDEAIQEENRVRKF